MTAIADQVKAEVKFNLNDKVRVKLTPYGMTVRAKWFAQFGSTPPETGAEDERLMWEFMNVYGAEMFMGNQDVFESMDVAVLATGTASTLPDKPPPLGNPRLDAWNSWWLRR